jgi:hypothetical protein
MLTFKLFLTGVCIWIIRKLVVKPYRDIRDLHLLSPKVDKEAAPTTDKPVASGAIEKIPSANLNKLAGTPYLDSYLKLEPLKNLDIPLELIGSIEQLLVSSDALERHTLFNNLCENAYSGRLYPSCREVLVAAAQAHITEYPFLLELSDENDYDKLINANSFKRYCMHLSEIGDIQGAIEVCQKALDLHIEDGTTSGYAGRMNCLLKDAASS